MKIGIIGLEYAGRRSLFSLLTGVPYETVCRQAECIGAVPVPDRRVDFLAELYGSRKKTYAQVIFSLFPPIHTSDPQRRTTVADTRGVDVVAIVVRGFTDTSVFHPGGTVDPVRDCATVLSEMVFADLCLVETRLERIEKQERARPADVDLLEKKTLVRFKEHLESGGMLNALSVSGAELRAIRSLQFLTLRPVFAVVNCDDGSALAPTMPAGLRAISVPVKMEVEIQQLPAHERRAFRESLGIAESPLDRMLRFAYELGNAHTFITAGEKETRAWTIRRGATALEAAGAVHSDFAKGFIRAEVVSFEDLMAAGSEVEAKRRGHYRLEGRDYVVRDGDVIVFRFNV